MDDLQEYCSLFAVTPVPADSHRSRLIRRSGLLEEKSWGCWKSGQHPQNCQQHHLKLLKPLETLSFLEKQMEFVPIEILLIVFLFFLYAQESTSINYI